MTDMRAALIVTADASSVVTELRRAAAEYRELKRETGVALTPPQSAAPSVDPAAALRREMAEQAARANRALADSLTPVIAVERELAQQQQATTRALVERVAATKSAEASAEVFAAALDRQEHAWLALEAAINPVIRAERELAAARELADQAVQSGTTNNTRAAHVLGELERRYQALVRAQSPAAASAAAFEQALDEEERAVRQVMLALDPAARAAAEFERMQERLTRALRMGIISQDEATRSLKLLEVQQQAVGRGGAAMGMGVQNASFQFTDMLVQLQGGVAWNVAIAQQLPQLLGGFGALGAVLGLAVAAGVPLLAMLFDMGDAAGDLDQRLDRLEQTLGNVSDHLKILRDVDAAETFGDMTDSVLSLTSALLQLERAAELKSLRETLDKLLKENIDATAGDQIWEVLTASRGAPARSTDQITSDKFAELTGGRGPSFEEFEARRGQIDALAKAGEVKAVIAEVDALIRDFAAGGPLTEVNETLLTTLTTLGKIAQQTAETEADFNGSAIAAAAERRIQLAQQELGLSQVIAQYGADSIEAEAERDRIARANYELELERAGIYGDQRDRLLEIWDQQNGVSDATAAWADTMAGVRGEVEGILSAIASLGGGLVDRAAKQAELKALEAGGTIAAAAAAGRATRRQAQADATAMQWGGGMVGRAVAGVQSWWDAGGDALDDRLAGARSDARKRERSSGGGRGGSGVGFASSIKEEIARLKPSYEADVEAAEAWRDKAMAGLKKAGAGYADFADDVELIYQERLAKAYEADLKRRDDWASGVERANLQLQDDMLSWADVSEDIVTNWAKSGEDAFVSFARTGKASIGDLADFAAEAFARMAYQQMIQPGLNSILNLASGAIGSALDITMPTFGATAVPTNHTGSPGVMRSYALGGYGDSMRSDERLTMMRRGEEIMTSRALENAGALISAMTSLAAAQAQPVPVENRTPIQVITQTSTPMQVEEREVTDVRGQRQQQLVISEVVSTGLGARGGAARKRLARDFGITPRGIRR